MNNLIVTTHAELENLIQKSIRKVLSEQSNLPAKEEKTYLSVSEAAEYTGNAVATLYALSAARKITYYKPNKNLLFMKIDLDKYILQSRRKSKSEIEEDIDNA